MNCNINRAPTAEQQDADKLINIGISMALITLADRQDWGKIRLRRLWAQILEEYQKEMKPNAPKYTKAYRDEINYMLDHLARAVRERMGQDDAGTVESR